MVMFFLKDGWSSKKTWTPLEGGASPTSLPTHCLTSRYCRLTNEKGDSCKKKRKNYHLWEQLSFLPSQGAIGTRSYSSGCFRQNYRWDPGWACRQKKIGFWGLSFLADEVLATKAGEHLDIKQREGIHHLFSQGVKFKMWMTILFIFHTNHKQILNCYMEWSTR